MAGGFQPLRLHHLCGIGGVSLFHSIERGSQFEYDVVFVGSIFRIVSQ